jgi:hypothetical protein
MKCRLILLSKAWCLLFFIVFLNGCSSRISIEEHSNEWVARPLAELKQEMKRPDSYASKIGWKEATYVLANGNFVYIEPISADCSVYWEINSGDIIIGYTAKGIGCDQGPATGKKEQFTVPK